MTNIVTVAVILAMIALGVLLIHLLNAQHDERIATYSYSRFRLGRRGRTAAEPMATTTQKPGLVGTPPARDTRRDHRDGGRGRLRPRGRMVRGPRPKA
jgi:hypothetical protein